MLSTRHALRLAQRLKARWDRLATRPPTSESGWWWFEERLERLQAARARLALARSRSLALVVPGLVNELLAPAAQLVQFLNELAREQRATSAASPTPRDWLAEVRQLDAEFGGVEVRWRDSILRVVTEPIELRDVELGPFAIEFAWDGVGDSPARNCFECVALEPNPASNREGITHPHVADGIACLGDATLPFEHAFADGRLADAFLILRSVLTTYNPQSPYVSLDEWHGHACSDCGYRSSGEDRSSCEACMDELCSSCCRYCSTCSGSRCNACLAPCDLCESDCCSACLESFARRRACRRCVAKCSSCHARHPKDELSDGTRFCSDCQQPEDPPDDDDAQEEMEIRPDVAADG